MPETLFIADLHLDSKKPFFIELCLDFLAGRARQADALYILGDLFEVWLGDDNDEPAYKPVLAALHNLTQSGIPVFIMHGNRDFLLGSDFLKTTGCQFIEDPYVMDLYAKPTLLMHGDTLCTLDTDYQSFRRQMRNPSWQRHFLEQPLAERRKLATQTRTISQARTQMTTKYMMDVTTEAVRAVLEKYGVYQLIHGHIHRPGIYDECIYNKMALRRVLGEWRDEEVIILSCHPEYCQFIDLLKNNE
ncbi:MAG: UDP-2,3-diacylglucosamine diphosphatase [Gammaproteobacteria bacterium]|nr:MAG: UDP-2,3-diacylglucosamine diphosphatase [Gammaproteobacteria bacterium]RKZ72131.1 MAG: UDP-2,3-diacylglucosamine diphosphatase [Gammaproteobacteria bacterium]